MEEVRLLLLPMNLQMFAKDGPGGEKTEPATQKKLSDARNKGQVAQSKDLGNGVILVAFILILRVFMGYLGDSFVGEFDSVYSKMSDFAANSGHDFNINMAQLTFQEVLIDILLIMLPFLAIGVVVAFIVDVIQVKWKIATEPLRPKFDKFNPISGVKRLFSVQSLVNLLKSILIIAALIIVVYNEVKDEIENIFYFYDKPLQFSIEYIGDFILDMGLKISIIMVLIGILDYIYQKIKFKNDMKMTKQEVKDEYKNSEGDPKIKSQQRQRMRQAAMRRMMKSVPTADVVITNPTHFAVAVKYEQGKARAPIVVAKGEDFLAAKIKDVAKEANVTIVENKPLARMLYYNVDIEQEIPPELYQAVAEVLAFVYKLKNKQV